MKKIKLSKDFYAHKHGEYVREKLASDKGCTDQYRIVEIKPGRKLLVCITNKEGKRRGKTKAVSLLRSKDIDLREYKSKKDKRIKNAILHFRKLKEKIKK